ncbi:MAG: hypothetical protein ACI9BW_004821 [Gammaproteobacteria bacterium]|jgi:hypothetical protein
MRGGRFVLAANGHLRRAHYGETTWLARGRIITIGGPDSCGDRALGDD